MRPMRVEPFHVPGDVGPRGADAVVGLQADAFVLDAALQPLDEDVVAPGAASVHRESAAALEYSPGEVFGGELVALVRVDDFRYAVAVEGSLPLHA